MLCKSCASVNQKEFVAEISLHFVEIENIYKPTVWAFPEVIICLDCGMASFSVTKDELSQLERTDSVASSGTPRYQRQ
jgi:hypothetical protein